MAKGRRPRGRVLGYAVAVTLGLVMVACGVESDPPGATMESRADHSVLVTDAALSDTARAGEEVFNANCSVCHGVGATGTDRGPALIHRIYHPGHHPDFSIRNAVSQGVRQHHWFFGNMAPVPGVSADEVEKIICYIRERQRGAGIFEGDSFSTVC